MGCVKETAVSVELELKLSTTHIPICVLNNMSYRLLCNIVLHWNKVMHPG